MVRLTRKEEEEGKEEGRREIVRGGTAVRKHCVVSEWLPYCLLLPWTRAWAGVLFFFFSSGQGSTLSRRLLSPIFGQLLLYIDSFHILTVTGLRRTGLDNSCSKVLDSNSIQFECFDNKTQCVFLCQLKKKEAFFFFFFRNR